MIYCTDMLLSLTQPITYRVKKKSVTDYLPTCLPACLASWIAGSLPGWQASRLARPLTHSLTHSEDNDFI